MKEPFIFYILMRNDLDSLNPGKACAQAAHAASKLSEYFKRSDVQPYKDLIEAYEDWLGDRGFGTTIVLECDIHELNKVVENAERSYITCGMVFDPTYPVKDGKVFHYVPLFSCGFLFCTPTKIKQVAGHLNLMK